MFNYNRTCVYFRCPSGCGRIPISSCIVVQTPATSQTQPIMCRNMSARRVYSQTSLVRNYAVRTIKIRTIYSARGLDYLQGEQTIMITLISRRIFIVHFKRQPSPKKDDDDECHYIVRGPSLRVRLTDRPTNGPSSVRQHRQSSR